jgi:nicotinate-nucleotide--dimethylbenzimidazole phosphoribosyltransferase
MNRIQTYAKAIKPLHEQRMKQMESYLDGLTKPVGSLGKLEEMMIQLAGIFGENPITLAPKVTVIMCSDNGVYKQGISECPQEVTKQVTENFTKGLTGMNKLSEFAGAKMHIVDIGIAADVENESIHNRKIAYGTKNFYVEPAMTYEEAIQAIEIGIEETEELIAKGYQVFGTGEMGIGNTTTSAAVASVLLGEDVEKMTGKGAGARAETLARKKTIIEEAIRLHEPNKEDAIDVLAKIGGFDIAGLCGVFLAAAKHQKPVVIDGLISSAAALVAYHIEPKVKDYLFASHLSKEVGMTRILEHMKLEAPFNLEMRLGEGSGCPILFQLMDMAKHVLLGMGTFEEANIDKGKYMNIWK